MDKNEGSNETIFPLPNEELVARLAMARLAVVGRVDAMTHDIAAEQFTLAELNGIFFAISEAYFFLAKSIYGNNARNEY